MCFVTSFCVVVEALTCLLVLLASSECRQMEQRNALVIVGSTSQYSKLDESWALFLNYARNT